MPVQPVPACDPQSWVAVPGPQEDPGKSHLIPSVSALQIGQKGPLEAGGCPLVRTKEPKIGLQASGRTENPDILDPKIGGNTFQGPAPGQNLSPKDHGSRRGLCAPSSTHSVPGSWPCEPLESLAISHYTRLYPVLARTMLRRPIFPLSLQFGSGLANQ
ncbi:hypothetical protein C8Q78DRAFT_501998 [Trametes maxima]|nr:hypothetical protein C8Q78DRAFT_501998 [Trametes maxima]